MNRQQIEACIPHRPPMLLIDEVLQRSEQRIVCRRRFVGDEYFFQGHYPGFPLVPGVILCEACMQAGAILLAHYVSDGVPVATRMNDVRFRQMVRPGDEIEFVVELTERLANAFFLRARATRASKVVMRMEFACTATGAADADE
jgi:3-hydroxyacyl-[acyl-carrier-protein] dehydratase